VVSILTPAEIPIAARRLTGARPHLAAVAGIVHREDLWQLCRDELTGADVRVDGWDIRGRWFGVVVGATPGLCLELIKEAGVSGKRTVGWQADCVIGAVR
jgi:hypothetical protein